MEKFADAIRERLSDIFTNSFRSGTDPAAGLRGLLVASTITALCSYPLMYHKLSHVASDIQTERLEAESTSGSNRRSLPPLRQRISNAFKLLRVACPRVKSRESLVFLILNVLLVVRTRLSIVIAQKIGKMAEALIRCERRPFLVALCVFVAWTIPAAVVNSVLRYCGAELQVSIRDRITRYLHGRVMQPNILFRLAAGGGLDELDQRLTQDVQRWADHAMVLYNHLFKPLLDAVLFARDVAQQDGGSYRAPLSVGLYFAAASAVVRLVSPEFGLLNSLQTSKDAALRSHIRTVVDYRSEIAVSQGLNAERRRLDDVFTRTNDHAKYVSLVRSTADILDQLMIRHGSVVIGYAVCARIAMGGSSTEGDAAAITGKFARSSTMLIHFAMALGQLLSTYRLGSVWLAQGDRVFQVEAAVEREERMLRALRYKHDSHHADGSGRVELGPNIVFDDVTVQPPMRGSQRVERPLLSGVTFHIKPGMNVLVSGPNGAGKSSLFRLLAELWPLTHGRIEKPASDQLYYVCQKPYMSSGSLRDQITYPAKFRDLKVGESALYNCLEYVGFTSLLDRPNVSWDSRLVWSSGDVLSAGEKQKIGVARMLFHKPRFVFLDECTSAVDLVEEARIYETCQKLNVTVVSIAHRRSVWRFHNWVLLLDGCGNWHFSPMRMVEELVPMGAVTPAGSRASTPTPSSPASQSGAAGTRATGGQVVKRCMRLTRIVASSDPARVGTHLDAYVEYGGSVVGEGSGRIACSPAAATPVRDISVASSTDVLFHTPKSE